MALQRGTAPGPASALGLAIDHVGVVVRDLAAEVERWRGEGFLVSDPVALMGQDGTGRARPLGQSSAHVVFQNAYVELSSPDPGSGNHLEPYLALGDGIRILVVAVADAETARAALAAEGGDIGPVRTAARDVMVEGDAFRATFRWFPLPRDIVPGVLSAVVEHETRDRVLHTSLCRHPNGLRRIDAFVAEGRSDDIRMLPRAVKGLQDAPPLLLAGSTAAARLSGLVLSGEREVEQFFRVTA
ncbi:VOC family protein [Alsobacter sp. R-9]